MLRGNRGFILAVIGFLAVATVIWTLLSPSYPIIPTSEHQKAEEGKYSPGSPACYPSRLNSLPGREAADERYRCEQGAEEHRLKSDDLVQQTRAADAAVANVRLTYQQSLMLLAGTIVGLLTLIAAFYAAWFAKRAAEAAEKGVRHAEDTSDAELRPWVSITVVAGKVLKRDLSISLEYDVIFENLGKTVAKNFMMHQHLDFFKPNEVTNPVTDWWNRWDPPKDVGTMVLMPGEKYIFPAWSHRSDVPWHGDPEDFPRNCSPFVVATAFYRSSTDAAWKRTNRSFTIGTRGAGMTQDYLTEVVGNLSGDQLVARPYSGPVAT